MWFLCNKEYNFLIIIVFDIEKNSYSISSFGQGRTSWVQHFLKFFFNILCCQCMNMLCGVVSQFSVANKSQSTFNSDHQIVYESSSVCKVETMKYVVCTYFISSRMGCVVSRLHYLQYYKSSWWFLFQKWIIQNGAKNTRKCQDHYWKARQDIDSYWKNHQIYGAFPTTNWLGKTVFITLESGINIRVRLLIFEVFFRGYVLIKGGYVYWFLILKKFF